MDVKDNAAGAKSFKNAQDKHHLWIGTYVLLGAGFTVLFLLLKFGVIDLPVNYEKPVQKVVLASCFAFCVLIASRLLQRTIGKRSRAKSAKYNLTRLTRLMSFVLIVVIFVSALFQNWYTAAVSLGLISLILGFALQTPISSFIGWLYIIFRSPYHIGDRIQIDEFTGDVVEINYLDTTLWEFAGDYLTNDMPSGRLIRFPNSLVLQSAVYNYSWSKFPYIWNEIPFHIAYESDLAYVEATLREAAKSELGPEMAERVEELKELVKETPIDELEIREYPYVSFRTNTNTWLEVIVTYLVPPKKATAIRNRILLKAVAALLKEPEKVMFPKSNAR